MDNKKQNLEVEFREVKSVKECCEIYFENYNKNYGHRKAWLLLREKRYCIIRDKDNDFYLGVANIFKNEVLKFWEGKDEIIGWNFENSKIRKKNGGWIDFQNEDGETPDSKDVIKELEKNNLELHGNYSWSKMFMGGDITADMRSLGRTVDFLINEMKSVEERINETLEWDGEYKIRGLDKSKATTLLHIFKPTNYGVWNGPVETTFKILSQVDDLFRIREGNLGRKYLLINKQLNYLLSEHPQKGTDEEGQGFKNLSDVDIFMWYVSINFELQDGKVFFKKYLKNNSKI
ncbi:hypothetical protein KKH38_03225 [Patescibacteria group bacterium]|nr:hypothetical protein [Patescibacteria group bacterium]MBU4141421.1 hypothetical protein [Patescibacteria group bacterium]MBU4375486.1 hypothetical protein [Patescibacteria group bacterium]MBU4600703.1 hypothetical protein [Patescibacteria group bacterium]MCG2698649.1 hypothetical protein [Candidatus Parcubacteria bacterium]